MGLVNYDSSDSEPEEQSQSNSSLISQDVGLEVPKNQKAKKIHVNPPTKTSDGATRSNGDSSGGFDIAALLPEPKNKTLDTLPRPEHAHIGSSIAAPLSRKSRTLGGGIKSQFEGEIKVIDHYAAGLPGIDVKPKSRKIVPASQLAREAKYGNEATIKNVATAHVRSEELDGPAYQAAAPLHGLFSYHAEDQITSRSNGPVSTLGQSSATSHMAPLPGYNDVSDEEERDDQQTLALNQFSSGKSKRKHVEIVDFNVDDYYEDNQKTIMAQPPSTRTKVHQIASGRHQLSSLISSAQLNKDALSEMYQENKRKRVEARKKYGF